MFYDFNFFSFYSATSIDIKENLINFASTFPLAFHVFYVSL